MNDIILEKGFEKFCNDCCLVINEDNKETLKDLLEYKMNPEIIIRAIELYSSADISLFLNTFCDYYKTRYISDCYTTFTDICFEMLVNHSINNQKKITLLFDNLLSTDIENDAGENDSLLGQKASNIG